MDNDCACESLQDVCEDKTVVDSRIKVSVDIKSCVQYTQIYNSCGCF